MRTLDGGWSILNMSSNTPTLKKKDPLASPNLRRHRHSSVENLVFIHQKRKIESSNFFNFSSSKNYSVIIIVCRREEKK
jgi:hypothetical protein